MRKPTSKARTEQQRVQNRRIADNLLLLRLGLSDDWFWDWEAACIEVPPEELEFKREFDAVISALVRQGCKKQVVYSCVHYFRHASDFELPSKRKLESLTNTCALARGMIFRHMNVIVALAEARRISPPAWVKNAVTSDENSGLSEAFDCMPPADRAVTFVMQLLRWTSAVTRDWECPNTAPFLNGALPLSLYADMISFDPSLKTHRENANQRGHSSKGIHSEVARLLSLVKRAPNHLAVGNLVKAESSAAARAEATSRPSRANTQPRPGHAHDRSTDAREPSLDSETLRKNLKHFAIRSPEVCERLRVRLVELHHWAQT